MVLPAMVRTPWGNADELRAKMLPPGRATPRREVERSQRERLFAAMVAAVAEKGYEATTVADLVELSGVSRSAFYQHFEGRQACFLATVEAVVKPALEFAAGIQLGDEDLARRSFEALVEWVVAQPSAAKTCFDVHAAGPEGVALGKRILAEFNHSLKRLLDSIPGHEDTPADFVRALLAGTQEVIHSRIYGGHEEELLDLAPLLWGWIFSYSPPPGPLIAPPRRALQQTLPFRERQAASNPPERILRALAAVVSTKGYLETSVAEIVQRAKTSQRTFYQHFANKEEALIAALDSGSAQMLAAALPAMRRTSDWQARVRATEEAMFTFGAKEPEYERLGGAEMFAAGRAAFEHREAITEMIEELLEPGFQLAPDLAPITSEAIGGSIYALLFDPAKDEAPRARLAKTVPLAVYITLAPFIGAEDAYAMATEATKEIPATGA